MKRSYIFIVLLLLLLTSCKGKTYTVTFVDDGEKLLSVEVKKGDYLGDVENPVKDGYIFLSWIKDGVEYNINNPIKEDITLEASWTPVPVPVKSYTVTFNFGNEIKTLSVKEGETVSKPKDIPQKEKHKFIGWYDGDTLYDFNNPVVKDFVLTAKFERSRVTVKYDLDGGSGTVQVEIDINSIPVKPKTPSKFGYTFKEWQIDGVTYNFDKPLDKDTTIKAIYEANVYVRISFDSDGGDEIASVMLISGETITDKPVPTKEGYKFLYWSYDDQEFDFTSPVTEDIALVAIYELVDENNE